MSLDAKLLDVIAEYPRLRAGLVHLGHPMVLDETLHRLQSQGLVDQDPITRLWSRTSTPAPESAGAPAVVTEHVEAAGNGLALGRSGLPASKIPGLEDTIALLDLDDVAEPLPVPDVVVPPDLSLAVIRRRVSDLESRLEWAVERLDRLSSQVHRLEHPEPVGPVAAPLGIHVECLRERKAIAAWVRAFAATDVGCDVSEYLDAIANDVADGKHHTVKP